MVLSIVIPCYNEEKNLPLILERFATCLSHTEMELIVVDNGSTDGSGALLSRLLPAHPFARLVTVAVNQGYGNGILAGLRASKGRVVGWTHADLQTDPADVVRGYQTLLGSKLPEATILKGRRTGRNALDAFFTWGMSVIASCLLGARLSDINAQPKLFNRELLDEMKGAPGDFSLDLFLLLLARRRNWSILEIPVSFLPRLHGEAKGGGSLRGKWKLIRRTLAYILRARRSASGFSAGTI